MNWISYASNLIIPLTFAGVLLYGRFHKINLFDTFADGAEDGLHMAVRLLPTFIGLFMAVACMRESGLLDFISSLFSPLSRLFHFSESLVPIAITKFISSSAATSLVIDLFSSAGPDAEESRMAAIMLGSTETVLYTMSVYYTAVHIRKTRWTLTGAILATIAGIIASVIIVNVL